MLSYSKSIRESLGKTLTQHRCIIAIGLLIVRLGSSFALSRKSVPFSRVNRAGTVNRSDYSDEVNGPHQRDDRPERGANREL